MQQQITISPSNVTWLSCLKRFEGLAVRRAYPGMRPASPVLRFATLTHKVMAGLYSPTAAPTPPPHLEQLEAILRLAFLSAGYDNEGDREFDMAKCRKLVRAYLAQADSTEDEATVAVERSSFYSVRVGGEVLYTLTARIDRVLVMKDKTVGVDLKVGAKIPAIEEIVCNMAALKAAYPAGPRWEFWIESLNDEGVDRTVFKAEQLKGAVRLITAQVRRFQAAQVFPPEPNENCQWCPYRPECAQEFVVDEEALEF